jgi:hypothetical protein
MANIVKGLYFLILIKKNYRLGGFGAGGGCMGRTLEGCPGLITPFCMSLTCPSFNGFLSVISNLPLIKFFIFLLLKNT